MTLKPTSLFCFLFCHVMVLSQGDPVHYPNGVYTTLEDFMAKNPDTVTMIRKVNLDVDISKAFLDTLVDRCFFINSSRDPVKKVFAIVYDGEIYFQEYSVSRHLMLDYKKRAKNEPYFCYRVLEKGAYMYCNVLDVRPGYYGGGLLGVALADLGPAVEIETGIAFHPRLERFFSF